MISYLFLVRNTCERNSKSRFLWGAFRLEEPERYFASHAANDKSTRVWFTIHWTRRYYSGVSHEDIENSPQRRFTITSSKKRWSRRIKTSWIWTTPFSLFLFVRAQEFRSVML